MMANDDQERSWRELLSNGERRGQEVARRFGVNLADAGEVERFVGRVIRAHRARRPSGAASPAGQESPSAALDGS